MSTNVAELLESPYGIHQIIPWKWMTSNTRNTVEILLRSTYGYAEDFSCGFSIHHLSSIELNDVKAIRYLQYRQVKAAISEIQNIINSNQYHELPTIDDSLTTARSNRHNTRISLSIYDDLIRKASNIEDLVEAILDRLDAEIPMSARDKAVICSRASWYTSTPQTLESIGRDYGLTRERIRQISKKYEEPINNFEGELRFAAELSRLASTATSIENLQELASKHFLTREEVLDISQCQAIMAFLPNSKGWIGLEDQMTSWENQEKEVSIAARKITKFRGKMGFINLAYASKELNLPIETTLEVVKDKYPRAVISGNLILARTDNIVSTFESAIAKQLLVFEGLGASELLIGARRHSTLRNDSMSEDEKDYINIIHSLCGNPPTLQKFMQTQLYETELSESDKWLVSMFQTSPNGLLHRVEITKFAIESKMNLGSITAYCGSSPFIRMHSNGVYSLINTKPNFDQISTHAELALSQDGAVELSIEFFGSNLWLTLKPNLNTFASGVLLPNREINDIFSETIFTPACSCGPIDSKQVLKVSKEGFWQGFQSIFSHALQNHDFNTKSVFKIYFDFDQNVANLNL